MFERYRVIHFVGIGGIGMSGIAEVLHNLDYEVAGSDLKESDTIERLRNLGMNIYIGHKAENVDGAHVVVTSSAVSKDNVEVVEAQRRAIPVIPRAEMLAELGRLKYAILVSGSHGKTTTTSLISTILAKADFDPMVVIGGRLKAMGTNARLGRGKFMVAEADESDGSLLKLNPTLAVVTNIDKEHIDHFRTMNNLKKAFVEFADKVPFYGLSFLCIDDKNIRNVVIPKLTRKFFTYGFSEDADLRAINLERNVTSMGFEAVLRGESLGRFELSLLGSHNVLNSLAAIAVALEIHIDVNKMREALSGFEGTQRRLELKSDTGGIRVYDDYAHHPTEIKATLKAVRESKDVNRLCVIFQPHRYTRTRDLMKEYRGSFGHADCVVLMDIYPAGEEPIKGVNTSALIKGMNAKKIYHMNNRDEIVKFMLKTMEPGDVVLTLGAGDVWKVGEELVDALGRKQTAVGKRPRAGA
jgi:UDP-N-acetylmuramate--alanine ligase